MHDVLNHIHDITSWEEILKNVLDNLTDTGYFLFDINTLYQLEQLASMPVWEKNFEENKQIQLTIEK